MVQEEGSYAAEKRENGYCLISRRRGDSSEFLFSDDGVSLASWRDVENKTPVREAAYSDYRIFGGWEKPLPARITLDNRRWGYQLRIELLKIEAAAIDGRLLEPSSRPNDGQ
jgi:hypothetical protein